MAGNVRARARAIWGLAMVEVLEMPIGYDKIRLNYQQVLALTFEEGAGLATYDRAKPFRPELTLIGAPTWTQIIPSGLTVLDFDGAGDWIEGQAADTVDLDFTTGDYSIAGWVNWTNTALSEMIIARYELDVSGWELYFWDSILQLRHHHAAGATVRTGGYSGNWTPGVWWFFGISRIGAWPLHYRNGIALEVGYSVGGMLDPETCNRDLVLGCRWTKNADWYQNQMWNIRLWDRALTAWDMQELFQMERKYFGV